MERSELLIVTGRRPLAWELTENEKQYIYTAKLILPFGGLKGEYNVVINKAPKRLRAHVSLRYLDPIRSTPVIRYICKNAIEASPMDITELIKLAEDDHYDSLGRFVEYQNKLYAKKTELVKELETINNAIRRISARNIMESPCSIMENPF